MRCISSIPAIVMTACRKSLKPNITAIRCFTPRWSCFDQAVQNLLLQPICTRTAKRPRMGMVALIMIVALPFTGIISANEALAGCNDSDIVLIAALFGSARV
jgi:di/tricarboxylate transporter